MAGKRGRKRVADDETELKVCQKYLNGASLPQVGKEYGLNPSTVYGILKRHGVKTRSLELASSMAEHYKKPRAVINGECDTSKINNIVYANAPNTVCVVTASGEKIYYKKYVNRGVHLE